MRHISCLRTALPVLVLSAGLHGSSLVGQEPARDTMPRAEPRVLGARFDAEIPEAAAGEQERTLVTVTFRLAPGGITGTVPLTGVEFGNTRIRELQATVQGQDVRVTLDRSRSPALEGRVRLPSPVPPGDTMSLTLRYQLERAIPGTSRRFDVILPLLLVDWTPAGAPEDMLRATISIPAEYSVQESFPTVPKEMTRVEEVRRYEFGLQVIPTMIRFRGHVGDPPLLTFGRMVDLGVLLLLFVAGALGWWGLRREKT